MLVPVFILVLVSQSIPMPIFIPIPVLIPISVSIFLFLFLFIFLAPTPLVSVLRLPGTYDAAAAVVSFLSLMLLHTAITVTISATTATMASTTAATAALIFTAIIHLSVIFSFDGDGSVIVYCRALLEGVLD